MSMSEFAAWPHLTLTTLKLQMPSCVPVTSITGPAIMVAGLKRNSLHRLVAPMQSHWQTEALRWSWRCTLSGLAPGMR
jgi:hypothetical protein